MARNCELEVASAARLRAIRMALLLASIFLAAMLPGGCQRSGAPQRRKAPGGSVGTSYALLVGCTQYDHLPQGQHLLGPANDARLLGSLLKSKFQFSGDHIVLLVEDRKRLDHRPSRANILRQLDWLANQAGPHDRVVVLLAGHGSQQPDDETDPDDFEPDGLDEVFCPCDVKPPSDGGNVIENGIVDDELRKQLAAIAARGAAVWLIVDACHSGTAARGGGAARGLPAEQFISAAALDRTRRHGKSVESGAQLLSDSATAADAPADVVAIYASSADEPTFEERLPAGAPDGRTHGLLSFALSQVLTQAAAPLTWRELIEQIQKRYLAQGRMSPTPSLEGPNIDREVLGQKQWPGRPRVTLAVRANGYRIDAGAVHEITPGSILAVFPPPNASRRSAMTAPLGHVRVDQVRAFDSSVSPVAYGGKPAAPNIPNGAQCRLVHVDYRLHRLKVAADSRDAVAKTCLTALASDSGSLVAEVADARQADWLLQRYSTGLFLVPASGAPPPESSQASWFGPAPSDDTTAWLAERLKRIRRATALLQLAAQTTSDESPVDVAVRLVQFSGPNDAQGKPLQLGAGTVSLPEERMVAFRIRNDSPFAVDVTLLFVDNNYGLLPYFPRPGTTGDNRLSPGQELTTSRAVVSGPTFGREYMVVIALRAHPGTSPVDFSFLSQPSVERVPRGASDRGVLEELLFTALDGADLRGGLDLDEAHEHAFQLLSWRTVPAN